MKKLFLMILTGLTTLASAAQSQTDTSVHPGLKKGIFFTFEQIVADSPALTDSFIIKERTSGDIAFLGGGKYSFEFVPVDKSEFKKVRKELIGISDGVNFYISDRFTTKGWQGMTVCALSGPYVLANIKGSAAQYTGGGLIPAMIKVGNGFLIDLRNGQSLPVTKKMLKELMAKYPEVLKKYKDKEDLAEFTIEIVNEINTIEKNKSTGK